MTSEEFAREDEGPTARHVVQALVGGFLVLFSAGVLVGFLAAVAEHGVRHGMAVQHGAGLREAAVDAAMEQRLGRAAPALLLRHAVQVAVIP